LKDESAASSSRCSRGEPSTLCGAGSDDEISLFPTATTPVPSPADDSSVKESAHEISIAGLPVSIEKHTIANVADPLRHRSRRTFVQMPPNQHCQLIQTPIDFSLPVTVIISLSTKVDK